MNTPRKIAIMAGVVMILGTAAGILSVAPQIDDPEYLLNAAAHANQVISAAFFHVMMVPAYVGLALVLYPLLRTYHERLTLGFVGFRLMAGMFLMIGAISLLVLLRLSQEFVTAGAPAASHFQTIGELLRTGRDLVNHVATILAVSFGGLLYYALLYQTRLVPRWLSGWGLVGTLLTIFATVLVMFRVIGIITTSYFVLLSPMALQEMVLAVWLIAKGFNPKALT